MLNDSSGVGTYRLLSGGRMTASTPLAAYTPAACRQKSRLDRCSTGFAAGDPVKLEWFSWSIFRLTSPTGKIVLTNPFVTNPDSKVKVADFPKADVIVVADGHRDEVGSTEVTRMRNILVKAEKPQPKLRSTSEPPSMYASVGV